MSVNESGFRNLVSGQTKGVPASVVRVALRSASLGYWLAMRLRNELFQRGWKSIQRTAVPVISVGNLTTGGTGKTPLVAMVCHLLQESGLRPGIVSRGYRSVDGGANDEKLVLSLLCPGVPHAQDPDRVAAAKSLTIDEHVDAIVMDDGFQHRRLHRDLDIVLIDATNPFGYGYLLPRGLLREPLSSLQRADVVMITRSDLVAETVLTDIEHAIIDAAPQLRDRVLRVVFQPTMLRNFDGTKTSLSDAASRPVHLMAGIGNPDAFHATAVRAGMRVAGTSWFPDHHHYLDEDLNLVRQKALASGDALIVTTLKDLVKLPTGCLNVRALEIAAVFSNPIHADMLHGLIQNAVVRQPTDTAPMRGT
ncbi:MAG: tetraacyldisaccharide 4'-kinase [Fuerstia sp.]|nr:tetraacyldisaccharide 4'-kinase [Fuerstiella sp.]